MLSSLPISNQFSSSIPRRGENFQPYVKANPKLIHSAALSNILRPKMAIVGFGTLRGGGATWSWRQFRGSRCATLRNATIGGLSELRSAEHRGT